ncbi:MAG: chemotaxis response regulator protein-glutamate methylesterase [Lachnospiraceae bacterium]|nr:chemotaxis response regulator protein-glutamate methylesterase [Lachnospiraceae bacterium]
MSKKILIVDDSALMRRVACDIIALDSRFEVEDTARNGLEALELLKKKSYDAVILDVNMPRMNGLELLREMQNQRIRARVMMFSTQTAKDTRETIEALELGAVDFIQKPEGVLDTSSDEFKKHFLALLAVVARAYGEPQAAWHDKPAGGMSSFERKVATPPTSTFTARRNISGPPTLRPIELISGEKIVAIASSTGGPKALQQVIPKLPGNLNAPVLLVQHMPAGFTKSLAERLDTLSQVHVKEAEEGDKLEKGWVYIAAGGKHMKVSKSGGNYRIFYTNEPTREGVRPCANYMYESLMDSGYAQICCAVLTGMGADGTEGIKNLDTKKKIHVIAQNEETCAVYGMPKAVAVSGLVNEVVPLDKVADAIVKNVGTK